MCLEWVWPPSKVSSDERSLGLAATGVAERAGDPFPTVAGRCLGAEGRAVQPALPEVPGRRSGSSRQAEQQAEHGDDEAWFHLAAPLRRKLSTHDAADAIRQREEPFKTEFLPGTQRVPASPMAAPSPKIPASAWVAQDLPKVPRTKRSPPQGIPFVEGSGRRRV